MKTIKIKYEDIVNELHGDFIMGRIDFFRNSSLGMDPYIIYFHMFSIIPSKEKMYLTCWQNEVPGRGFVC